MLQNPSSMPSLSSCERRLGEFKPVQSAKSAVKKSIPMTHRYDTFPTPLGEFSAAVNETGALAATAFGGLAALKKRVPLAAWIHDPAALGAVRRQIDDFLSGRRTGFTVKVDAAGTSFQQAVWGALRRIPFGQTRSYAEIAAAIGRPGAARAVGRANATNPVCVVVPCHRVIGADGSLTGFAFGEKIKRRLLELEQVG
jgi:methylated-DNA-[protein]-cysteine S-methyltransferase